MKVARILVTILPLALACENGFVDPNGGVESAKLVVDGRGDVPERFTAELWVVGNVAYTTTWGSRTSSTGAAPGNAIKIWDVSGSTPVLRDSVIVSGAITLGDIQASDDGKLLVVATELSVGSIVVFDISDPLHPQQLSRFSSANTEPGVHTAEVQRVNGKLYAFLSVDRANSFPARLVIVDLSNPAAPTEVLSKVMGDPYVHDVYVRDGILMTALWNAGVSIFDIGGGGKGGTISAPVLLGNVKTVGGKVHNIWWYHDPGGSNRYAIVGEEGPVSLGAASGDIHVLDVSDFANPVEVAFYSVAGAGTHNFSVDENRGILFAAYYNAGVKALDIRGDLGGCSAKLKSSYGRCDLAKMGREIGHGLSDAGMAVNVWGVQSVGAKVYASDMFNGLWKLQTVP
jgi:hypothetical protein